MVIRDGRRTMPIGYTHQFPATFDGRARMNVQNRSPPPRPLTSAGAHLHDIRHGLRTFTTAFFQAPGRLNLVDSRGVKVLLDYAHNAAGLQTVGDFVERMTSSTCLPRATRARVVDGEPARRRGRDRWRPARRGHA